jgi:UDP-N-acetylmuramate--alanine ligase
MHIFFSGIGGSGIGPLAVIAKQAGYEVSGSDKQHSDYITYLHKQGITDIHIGQTENAIRQTHQTKPIDWIVFSSAIEKEHANHPEMLFAVAQRIKYSKRDEFLSSLLQQQHLPMLAVAGTHGKTTTTAMLIWVLQELHVPISYSVGAKTSFSSMGHFEPTSLYFVYECDEYDRNFLAYHPVCSLITGVTWDHHDIYPTKAIYAAAFEQFMGQSQQNVVWEADRVHGERAQRPTMVLLEEDYRQSELSLTLLGEVNRRNAWQVISAVRQLLGIELGQLVEIVNRFPGVSRRFEKIANNIYTDYAHTAEKIKGAIQVARETARPLVVVYEGLHNRRQHFLLEQGQFTNLFAGADEVFWVPSYLAREDPAQELLAPERLIAATGVVARPAHLNDELEDIIRQRAAAGHTVLCLSAGGGGSLDEWVRKVLP